ncbi:alanine--glyoxylate aminotransferase family protein, partial [Streptomyces sp. NPDC001193]
MTHPLLDLPPLTAEHFASIEQGVADLLSTRQDVVITQGEALLPLEELGHGPAAVGVGGARVE